MNILRSTKNKLICQLNHDMPLIGYKIHPNSIPNLHFKMSHEVKAVYLRMMKYITTHWPLRVYEFWNRE